MSVLDDRMKDVYDKIDRQKDQIISEIEKSESRSERLLREKLSTLKELIDQSNTARSDQVDTELSRLNTCRADCVFRCSGFRADFEKRLKEVEDWKALNWQRTIIYAGVAVIAAVQVFDWVKGGVH